MSEDPRAIARDRLARLLPQVMADGRVDESEKLALKRIFSQAVLTVADVKEVLGGYLRGLEAEVLADGVVTDEEQRRCRTVVRELGIPRALLSAELLAIVDDAALPK